MKIRNFTNRQELNIVVQDFQGTKFISLQQPAGSMRFQMDITSDEARHFAKCLMKCADMIEGTMHYELEV